LQPEIEIWIDLAEATWLDKLYAHAETIFRNSSLPSHDQTHHRRVWNLCKTILREISTFSPGIDQSLVEGVLVAAFFHDLGMASSIREDHGKLGSDQCRSWFRETGTEHPRRFGEILRAIELHDRKDLQIYTSFNRETPPEILGILSVSDDLEALGTIGIYRYTEIYLQRGITLEELGNRILENARSRFENLSAGCRFCHRLIEKYRPQYDELALFFEHYNLQLKETPRPDTVFSGRLGVINYIRTKGTERITEMRTDSYIFNFFRELENEMYQARI
jgi:hypothetical protein